MTKKDYILIAAALKQARAEFPTMKQNAAHDYVASVMCKALCTTNPRFDSGRFLAACRVVDETLDS